MLGKLPTANLLTTDISVRFLNPQLNDDKIFPKQLTVLISTFTLHKMLNTQIHLNKPILFWMLTSLTSIVNGPRRGFRGRESIVNTRL